MRDIDIRRRLLVEMNRRHGGEPDTLVIEELGLCQGIARIDLAVVNGSIHGYEIKSERDTLARLPAQAEIYGRTLEYVTLIAAPVHLKKVRDVVPKWWGIWSATQMGGVVNLTVKKEARRNPALTPVALAQLLWRDEALQALIDHNLAIGMKSKSRQELWERLSSELTVNELGNIVRHYLKRRGGAWRAPALQA